MDYEAALRSERYVADLDRVPPIPGGPLAADLAEALERDGVGPVTVTEREPLWVVTLPPSLGGIEVIVSLYEPHASRPQAVWNVSIASSRTLIDRLLRRPEPATTAAAVRAVHAALQRVPGVSDLRWFTHWPAAPYATSRYSRTPPIP